MPFTTPPPGDSFAAAGLHHANLKVTATVPATLAVLVSAGTFWNDNKTLIEFTGATSTALSLPSTNSKLCVIALDLLGNIDCIESPEAAAPILPTIPADRIPLAAVLLTTTDTQINSDMIFDLRPVYQIGANLDDTLLVSQIAGLPSQLDLKANLSLLDRFNASGTDVAVWELNKNHTGLPGENAVLRANRGSLSSREIRWNESLEQWEFTNDGIVYVPMDSANSSGINIDTSALEASITANEDAIIILQASVAANASVIAANASSIVVNQAATTSSFAVINASVAANASSITVLQASVTANETAIGLLGNTSALNASIAANASSIVVNQAATTSSFAVTNASVAANASSITVLFASVAANASAIALVTGDGGNASSLAGMLPSASTGASTIVARNATGQITSSTFEVISGSFGDMELRSVSSPRNRFEWVINNSNPDFYIFTSGGRVEFQPNAADNASAICLQVGNFFALTHASAKIVRFVNGSNTNPIEVAYIGASGFYAGPDGSATSPAFTFRTDTNTGMFLNSAGVVALAASSVEVLRASSLEIVATVPLFASEIHGPLYDIAGTTFTQPTASVVLMRFAAPRPYNIPAGYTSSVARSGISASGATVYTLKRLNAVDTTSSVIGTITWAAGSIVGVYADSGELAIHPFVIGDILSITAPATPDDTHDELSWTIVGTTT